MLRTFCRERERHIEEKKERKKNTGCERKDREKKKERKDGEWRMGGKDGGRGTEIQEGKINSYNVPFRPPRGPAMG